MLKKITVEINKLESDKKPKLALGRRVMIYIIFSAKSSVNELIDYTQHYVAKVHLPIINTSLLILTKII